MSDKSPKTSYYRPIRHIYHPVPHVACTDWTIERLPQMWSIDNNIHRQLQAVFRPRLILVRHCRIVYRVAVLTTLWFNSAQRLLQDSVRRVILSPTKLQPSTISLYSGASIKSSQMNSAAFNGRSKKRLRITSRFKLTDQNSSLYAIFQHRGMQSSHDNYKLV